MMMMLDIDADALAAYVTAAQRFDCMRASMPRHDALPPNLPPRGLCRDAAAQYVGVSATKFDELVRDGRMPKPLRIDGRIVWDRRALDRAFDALAGEPHDDGFNEFDRFLGHGEA